MAAPHHPWDSSIASDRPKSQSMLTSSLSAICATRAVAEDDDAATRAKWRHANPGEESEALLVALGDAIEFEHGSPTFYRHGQWPRVTRRAP